MRQELNRAKDAFGKERQAKIQLQQEVMQLREQLGKLEKAHESLDRDAKALPGLMESNEILKNDLNQLRIRYKEEKQFLQNQVKALQAQIADVDTLRNEMRAMGLRMVDIATNSNNNAQRYASGTGINPNYANNSSNSSPNRGTNSNMKAYDPYGNPSLLAHPSNASTSNMNMNMNMAGNTMSRPQPGQGSGGYHEDSEDNDDHYDEDDHFDDDTNSIYTHNTYYEVEDTASVASNNMSKVRQTLNRNVYGNDGGMASYSTGPAGNMNISMNMNKNDKNGPKKPRKRRTSNGGPNSMSVSQQSAYESMGRMANSSSLPKI